MHKHSDLPTVLRVGKVAVCHFAKNMIGYAGDVHIPPLGWLNVNVVCRLSLRTLFVGQFDLGRAASARFLRSVTWCFGRCGRRRY